MTRDELAINLFNSMNQEEMDEDTKQDICLMIIEDFNYIQNFDSELQQNLISELINSYNERDIQSNIYFNDGFGKCVIDNTKYNNCDYRRCEYIIESYLLPKDKEIIKRYFGLDEYPKQSFEDISSIMNIPLELIKASYNNAITHIKSLLHKLYY